MHVDHDGSDGGAERIPGEHAVERTERVFIGAHEQPAHDLHDQHLATVGQMQLGAAAAGRAGQHVERPDQARILVDVADQLALIEHMVTGGDQIGAGGVEIPADLRA